MCGTSSRGLEGGNLHPLLVGRLPEHSAGPSLGLPLLWTGGIRDRSTLLINGQLVESEGDTSSPDDSSEPSTVT